MTRDEVVRRDNYWKTFCRQLKTGKGKGEVYVAWRPLWYVYGISDGTYIKIGKTDNIPKRIKELQTGNPHKLVCIWKLSFISPEYQAYFERSLHNMLEDKMAEGEWFLASFSDTWIAIRKIAKAIHMHERPIEFYEGEEE